MRNRAICRVLNAAKSAPLLKNLFPEAEQAQKAFSKPDDGLA
jgi:hypothetical protein